MKISRTTAFLVFAANIFCLQAQTISIHKVDGTKLEYHCGEVDSIVNYQIMPETETREAVDLGLSVLWATCNVGADKPFQGGNKYAWGETEPKEEGKLVNSWYYNDFDYTSNRELGSDISGTIYDAAHFEWGGDWRMPTQKEMEELVNNCTWDCTNLGNVYLFKVTGNNGNYIFLPIPDYYYDDDSVSSAHQYSGDYWTSTATRHSSYLSLTGYYSVFGRFSKKSVLFFDGLRFSVMYIRPVKNK